VTEKEEELLLEEIVDKCESIRNSSFAYLFANFEKVGKGGKHREGKNETR
jgi:hypothetical protein